MKTLFPLLLLALLANLTFQPAHGQASSFTYQGQLRQNSQPFTGTADLEFRLYDDLLSGAQVGGLRSAPNWPIEDGLFQVELDFGAAAFDGSDRFLEIRVDGAPLSPRQKVTATPYALLATGLASGSVDGGSVDPTEVQLRVAGTCTTGEYIRRVNQNGSVICGVDNTGTDGWNLSGNAGLPNGAFIGTTDDAPVNIHVDGKRAMRYEWGFSSSGAPNVIGGVSANSLPDNYEASVIAGGGLAGAPNSILGNASVIGGGIGNEIDGNWSAIPGGRGNAVNASDSVAMGQGATANHNNVFIWNDGGSFASTGPDQFLIDADGGVGIGTNNPSDLLHLSLPAGDAMRVQIGGQTRFRIHDNGGVSIGVNANPPGGGLLVRGDIRYEQPRIRVLNVAASAFNPINSSTSQFNWQFKGSGALEINQFAGCNQGQFFRAPLQLPQDAVVREIHTIAKDEDAGNNFDIQVLRTPISDPGNNSLLSSISSNGANGDFREFSDLTISNSQIDNAQYSYRIIFAAGCGGRFSLSSVRFVYELREVL